MIYRNLCLIFSHISFCFYTCAFQCASASFALFSFHFSCSLSFSSLLLCNPASFHLSHLIRYFNFRFFNYYFSLTLSFPLPTPILNLTLGILPFQNMSSFCLVIMLETNKSTPVITFVAFYFLISLFLFFLFFFFRANIVLPESLFIFFISISNLFTVCDVSSLSCSESTMKHWLIDRNKTT